jgi:hypothetical protein
VFPGEQVGITKKKKSIFTKPERRYISAQRGRDNNKQQKACVMCPVSLSTIKSSAALFPKSQSNTAAASGRFKNNLMTKQLVGTSMK